MRCSANVVKRALASMINAHHGSHADAPGSRHITCVVTNHDYVRVRSRLPAADRRTISSKCPHVEIVRARQRLASGVPAFVRNEYSDTADLRAYLLQGGTMWFMRA